MLPSPSSSPPQVLHERTNLIVTPIQTRLSFALPTPPRDTPRVFASSSAGLSKKRKHNFSTDPAGNPEFVQEVDSDGDVEMEDVTPRPRARQYTPFHKVMRRTIAAPGRRREDFSTRAILQSFISSNKSDIYKCQSSDVDVYLTPPYACAKNGGVPILAVATEQGTVHLVNTSRRKDWYPGPPQTTLQVHQNGIFDVKWNNDDTLLATGSGDQSTHITCVTKEIVTCALRGHTSTVKCVTWDPSNTNLLSTGGRDGTICLWDLRVAGTKDEDGPNVLKPVISIPGAHEDSTWKVRRRGKKVPAPRSITSLLYPEIGNYGLVSSGSFDGVIKHWDLRLPTKRKGSVKPKPPANLFSSADDPTTLHGSRRPRAIVRLTPGTGLSSGLVFGLGADSRVHVYDAVSLNPLPMSYSHRNMQTNSFYVGLTLSHCGRWLATGSGAVGKSTQGSAFLYDVGNVTRQTNPAYSQEGVQLIGQQGEVGAVDWADNMLASCADDGTVRVWRPDVEIYRECIRDPEKSRWDWSWHS
ncbi:Denticleless like protein [Termitomyces sp. T112]|nr:Denticleless like protein [Termitomyces sp. T112]